MCATKPTAEESGVDDATAGFGLETVFAGAAALADGCNGAWGATLYAVPAAAVTATAAAVAFTAALPADSDLRAAAMVPTSSACRARRKPLRFGFLTVSGCSSPWASERRARKISVSTAELGELQLLGDLAIREPLPLAQQDRAALLLGHQRERVLDPDQLVALPARAGDDLLDDLEVARALDPAAAPRGAAAGETDVLGDLEQPGRLGLGHDAAAERAESVHVRRLDGVLGLLARAELVQAVALELRGVALVKASTLPPEGRCESARQAKHVLWTELRPNWVPLMWRDGQTGVRPNASLSVLACVVQGATPFEGSLHHPIES